MKRHELRRLPKERGVTNVDNIYHILLHHWVRDDSIFPDEQQRNQVAAGILIASYFGCRPVSMFDTRLQFQDEGEEESPSVEDAPSGLSSEASEALIATRTTTTSACIRTVKAITIPTMALMQATTRRELSSGGILNSMLLGTRQTASLTYCSKRCTYCTPRAKTTTGECKLSFPAHPRHC